VGTLAYTDVKVEMGADVFEATAVVTKGEEREKLWKTIVERHPFFGERQAKVSRQIPVVLLKRKEG
jgi:hypothetical protein